MTEPGLAKQVLRDALAHYHAGRYREADDLCGRVLRNDHANADAHHLRGVLAMRKGDPEAAVEEIAKAIRLKPAKAEYHNTLGAAYARQKKHAHAIHHFWQALALEPNYVAALRNLGQALREVGHRAEAVRVAQQALALDPHSVEQPDMLCEVGKQLAETKRFSEAIVCYRRAATVDPDYVGAYQLLVPALERDGRIEEAMTACRKLLSLRPDDAEAIRNLGALHLQAGRLEEAKGCFRKAIECSPRFADAHLALAECRRFRPGDPDIERMRVLCEDESTTPPDRTMLHFALGKAYEDTEDYGQAFQHYQAGNSLQRRQVVYDPQNTTARIDALIGFFSKERFAELGDRLAVDSDLPIFIVGMPRSGTTLVEQIIASHPAAYGAGELNDLKQIQERLPQLVGSTASYPYCVAQLPAPMAKNIAKTYVEKLASLAPRAGRVTDKMPWNLHMLGLIALLWPNAKVVHCRRDPLDTCLSCYTRYFATGQPYSWDLAELGYYYREYQRLTAHWRAVLPIPVFDVQYEQLVSQQEPVSRALIDFCGLDWDGRCLTFHGSARRIKPNPVDARKPVYSSSIGRWRRFAAHLTPLKQALEGQPPATRE